MKFSKAFDKIFGQVNTSATSRKANTAGVHSVMRVGKTAKDKANGHIAGKKNRRVWSSERGRAGEWVKV